MEIEKQKLETQKAKDFESIEDRKLRQAKSLFAKRDRFLDTSNHGLLWLNDPFAAESVVRSLLWGTPHLYELFSWVVMANHVHVLLKPVVELAVITQGIKGFTSYKINRQQKQLGRVFWQDESYDHWTRDKDEFLRIIFYIEQNPVVAGLCAHPADWLWSSARWRDEFNWKRGDVLTGDCKEQILKSFLFED